MVKNRHFLAKNDHFLVKNAYFRPFCAQKWVPWRPKKGRQMGFLGNPTRTDPFFWGRGLYTLVSTKKTRYFDFSSSEKPLFNYKVFFYSKNEFFKAGFGIFAIKNLGIDTKVVIF